MRKALRKLSTVIMIVFLAISVYFIYDFQPSRDIMGLKVFYDKPTQSVVLGHDTEPKYGDTVILMQDEQAVIGELESAEDYDVIKVDDMSISIIDGMLYRKVISVNQYVLIGSAVLVLLIVIADKLRRDAIFKTTGGIK